MITKTRNNPNSHEITEKKGTVLTSFRPYHIPFTITDGEWK